MANNIFKELEKGSLTGVQRIISVFPSCTSLKTTQDRTPLHIAAALGNAAFVTELLTHGAPYNAVDKDGLTPLHMASEQGWLDVVSELLTGPGRKLVLKAKSKDGHTPLHLAARGGHAAVVARLLDAGARTDAKDKAGGTPLDMSSNIEVQQVLMGQMPGVAVQPGAAGSTPATFGGFTPSPTPALGGTLETPPPAKARSGVPSLPLGLLTQSTHSPLTSRGGIASANSARSRRPPSIEGSLDTTAGVAGMGTPTTTSRALQQHELQIHALQAGARTVQEKLDRVDATATAQLEMSQQLERALHMVDAQAKQMAKMEEQLAAQAEHMREFRSRFEQLQGSAHVQETLQHSLQSTLANITADNKVIQARVGELTGQLEQVANNAAAATAATRQQGPAQVPAELLAQVSAMQRQLEVLQSVDALSHLQELSTQVQQLNTRAAMGPAVDSLERRVTALQEAALPDKMQLLQLKLLQVSTPLTSLQQRHEELAAQVAAMASAQTNASPAGLPVAGSRMSSGGGMASELTEQAMQVLATTAESLSALQSQHRALDQRVAALQSSNKASASNDPQAAATATAIADARFVELREQIATLQTAMTVLAAQQQRLQQGSFSQGGELSLGDGSISFAAPAVVVRNLGAAASEGGGAAGIGSTPAALAAQVAELKAAVAEVKRTSAADVLALRRDMAAPIPASPQHAQSASQSPQAQRAQSEREVQLQQREKRVEEMKGNLLAEELQRLARLDWEKSITGQIATLSQQIDTLGYKVDTLEWDMSETKQVLSGYSPSNSPRVAAGVSPSRLGPRPANAAVVPSGSSSPPVLSSAPASSVQLQSVPTLPQDRGLSVTAPSTGSTHGTPTRSASSAAAAQNSFASGGMGSALLTRQQPTTPVAAQRTPSGVATGRSSSPAGPVSENTMVRRMHEDLGTRTCSGLNGKDGSVPDPFQEHLGRSGASAVSAVGTAMAAARAAAQAAALSASPKHSRSAMQPAAVSSARRQSAGCIASPRKPGPPLLQSNASLAQMAAAAVSSAPPSQATPLGMRRVVSAHAAKAAAVTTTAKAITLRKTQLVHSGTTVNAGAATVADTSAVTDQHQLLENSDVFAVGAAVAVPSVAATSLARALSAADAVSPSGAVASLQQQVPYAGCLPIVSSPKSKALSDAGTAIHSFGASGQQVDPAWVPRPAASKAAAADNEGHVRSITTASADPADGVNVSLTVHSTALVDDAAAVAGTTVATSPTAGASTSSSSEDRRGSPTSEWIAFSRRMPAEHAPARADGILPALATTPSVDLAQCATVASLDFSAALASLPHIQHQPPLSQAMDGAAPAGHVSENVATCITPAVQAAAPVLTHQSEVDALSGESAVAAVRNKSETPQTAASAAANTFNSSRIPNNQATSSADVITAAGKQCVSLADPVVVAASMSNSSSPKRTPTATDLSELLGRPSSKRSASVPRLNPPTLSPPQNKHVSMVQSQLTPQLTAATPAEAVSAAHPAVAALAADRGAHGTAATAAAAVNQSQQEQALNLVDAVSSRGEQELSAVHQKGKSGDVQQADLVAVGRNPPCAPGCMVM